MMNTSTDSVTEEFNSKPNRVPVLGIVLPLFIVIPIGIALGLSFHKFHKRRQKLYKKEGLSPRDRPRINAPGGAVLWEVEFVDLLNVKGKNENQNKTKSGNKYNATSDKKYKMPDIYEETTTTGNDVHKAEFHHRSNQSDNKYWAIPRQKKSDLESMQVISQHGIKYNTRKNESTKRKLLDINSVNT